MTKTVERKPLDAPIRIWYQLVASENRMSNSIAATGRVCARAAAKGTQVEVRGTRHGALGDQFRFFWHYDVREIIDNGLAVRGGGQYDAFVIANSLDPGLVELREILDIPVLSFMEVCCFTACTLGDRFALISPNARMNPHYESIVRSYGLHSRLAAIEPLLFNNISRFDEVFTDQQVGAELAEQMDAACRRAVDRGAEVIIMCGPSASYASLNGMFEYQGAIVLDAYSLVVKAAEAMVAMHRLTGQAASRRLLYQSPPQELIRQCAQVRNIEVLRNG
ncbi:MAG: hypothetical protein J0H09_17860 [Burkholderiales bacterium]|nr:hypothetical protein [Burkholderiales bacterium]